MKPVVGHVAPTPGAGLNNMTEDYGRDAGVLFVETRVENPEHDSLFTRFEQLEELLTTPVENGSIGLVVGAMRDARALVRLIRAQVLK